MNFWYSCSSSSTYITLFTSGRLNDYLADIDGQAQKRLFLMTKQIAEQENVNEQLKADNAMLWVQKMNIAFCKQNLAVYIDNKTW